jgi:hypothetical protein
VAGAKLVFMAKGTPLHVNILAWVGHEEKARIIEEAVRPHADQVSVIYSVPAEPPDFPQTWTQVDYACFFGCKFREALALHKTGTMLQIQADAHIDNWGQLISRCRDAFDTIPDLGVWGPDVDYTMFTTDKVFISEFDRDKSLISVRQTDAIVWAISETVIERMGQADYSGNRLGWGIDSMAIAFAYANNMLVLRDTSLLVSHPKGMGYGQDEATQQLNWFLEQMTPQEKIQMKITRIKAPSPLATKDLLYLLARRLGGRSGQ